MRITGLYLSRHRFLKSETITSHKCFYPHQAYKEGHPKTQTVQTADCADRAYFFFFLFSFLHLLFTILQYIFCFAQAALSRYVTVDAL